MPRRITIDTESGIARVIDSTLVAEAPLAELSPYLEVRMPSVFPVLPDHTRVIAFDPDSKRGVVIIEMSPARHNLRVHYDTGEYQTSRQDYKRRDLKTGRANFNIQLPYQLFCYAFTLSTKGSLDAGGEIADFTLDHGLLCWRPAPLATLGDKLWPAKLWNVRDTHICWGYQKHDNHSFARRLDDMVKSFPHTEFTPHYGNPTPSDYKDYTEWEKGSEGLEGAVAYTEWKYFDEANSHITVQRFIDKYLAKGIGAADMSTSADAIPTPPTRFTIGKMIDWFEHLPEPHKRLFTESVRRYTQGLPELLDDPAIKDVVVAKATAKTTIKAKPDPDLPKGAKAATAEDGEVTEVDGVKVTIRKRKPTHAADGTPL